MDTSWAGGRPVRAHRLAYLLITGKWPAEDIFHINEDTEDNRWENLETRSEHAEGERKEGGKVEAYGGPVCVGGVWVS